jgi:hypothetical protein
MAYNNHIVKMVRSLKPLPPPPRRDPAAGPTLREILARPAIPAKPTADYPEIPPSLRMYFTGDELDMYDVCQRDAKKVGT